MEKENEVKNENVVNETANEATKKETKKCKCDGKISIKAILCFFIGLLIGLLFF